MVATSLKHVRVKFVGEPPDALPETATITQPRPEAEIRAAVAEVLLRSDRMLAEDLIIAFQVRARLAEDTGERIELVDFIRQEGFDPSDFGLE